MKLRDVASYALLAATWITAFGLLLHHWLTVDHNPPAYLIALVGALPVVPLAQTLQIGNLFTFSRKLNHLTAEVNLEKQRVRELDAQLQQVSVSVNAVSYPSQTTQQIVANLTDPQAAEAFATAFAASQNPPYASPPAICSVEEANLACFFISSANEIISLAAPSLLAALAYCRRFAQPDCETEFRQPSFMPVTQTITELTRILTDPPKPLPFPTTAALPHLAAIQLLIDTRASVDADESDPPTIEHGRQLLSDARYAATWMSGTVSIMTHLLAATLTHIGKVPDIPDFRAPPSH